MRARTFLWAWVLAVAVGGAAWAIDGDRMRGLLYRIDGEAHAVWLHPDAASSEADAAARFAVQASGRLMSVPALRGQAIGLRRAAEDMRVAVRQGEEPAARAAAIELAVRVRVLDEALPPR
jgi:hypothetical protein